MPSFRVGSIAGIPIKLGLSFLLVLPLLAWLIASQVGQLVMLMNSTFGTGLPGAALSAGTMPYILGLAAALGLFAGVILHELGHSVVAMRFGYDIDSITLWFLGGIAQMAEMPEDWRQEFAVAVAGPVVSVVLGIVSYAAFLVVPEGLPGVRFVVAYLALLNVALAAFNLLPGFPMDGGRVLRALLARNRTHARATQIAAEVGKGFAFLLALVGLFAGAILYVAIAFFIYISAAGEAQQAVTKAALQGVVVERVMTPADEIDAVTPETSVADLVDRMLTERHTGYPVLDGGELVGMVTLSDAQTVREVERDAYRVGEVMSQDLYTVPEDSDAMDALSTMQSNGVGRLPVLDLRGEFIGLVSRTDLMTALTILQSSGMEATTDAATQSPRSPDESF
ncbi:CBS domain-containing protein [Halococcus thailandensis]|uniref:Zinc metalloprotease n=1 Tax=Halococcus thailandensis JCM 13552 TaxID=1227457 RepID=M0N7L2_9EURY|nr:CBS domain-containing protein [Halococcus thailandensis]EMA53109.1 metalloprotease [Halococcus thailandensis JCM 13552]